MVLLLDIYTGMPPGHYRQPTRTSIAQDRLVNRVSEVSIGTSCMQVPRPSSLQKKTNVIHYYTNERIFSEESNYPNKIPCYYTNERIFIVCGLNISYFYKNFFTISVKYKVLMMVIFFPSSLLIEGDF